MADDTLNSQSPASTGSQQRGATSIVALLAKLDRQIEEDRPASVQNDLVAETVAHLLTLLPSAAPTDAELVFALPAHFAKRAREAEAGGRQSEANRFAALGSVFESLLKPKDTTGPRAPMRATAGHPTLQQPAVLQSRRQPASLPEDVAGMVTPRSTRPRTRDDIAAQPRRLAGPDTCHAGWRGRAARRRRTAPERRRRSQRTVKRSIQPRPDSKGRLQSSCC